MLTNSGGSSAPVGHLGQGGRPLWAQRLMATGGSGLGRWIASDAVALTNPTLNMASTAASLLTQVLVLREF